MFVAMDSKVLIVNKHSYISSSGYKLIKQDFEGEQKERLGIIKSKVYTLLSEFCLTRRLVRAELTGIYELKDSSMIAVAKKGLYKREAEGGDFRLCFKMPRGSKPLRLCVLPNGHIYFGEYFQNVKNEAVHIYGSRDNGNNWEIVYTFPADEINHVHGVFYDSYTGRMWFLTGDRENECIIGYTEDEFETVVEVFRGGQEYRSCQLFFYPDFIVFATDSQYMQNEIKCFDRKTLKITSLAKIQGSAVKGGQSGNVSFLSTTVEPSSVNKDKSAHIWMTKDGLHWKEVFSAEKDSWPFLFQFGTFEFPQYMSLIQDTLWFNGRALKGCDGKIGSVKI